jgi:hypothetical protein
MTRHNDETHPLSTAHEAQTRHNDAHPPRFRWSDEAHHEAPTRHKPTRHNGQHPFRGAPCRLVVVADRKSLFFPTFAQRELSAGTAKNFCLNSPGRSRSGTETPELP